MLGAFFLPVTLLFAIYTLTIDSGFAGHLCLVSWGGLGLLTQIGLLPPPMTQSLQGNIQKSSLLFHLSFFFSVTSLLLKTLKATSTNWEVGVVVPTSLLVTSYGYLEHSGM